MRRGVAFLSFSFLFVLFLLLAALVLGDILGAFEGLFCPPPPFPPPPSRRQSRSTAAQPYKAAPRGGLSRGAERRRAERQKAAEFCTFVSVEVFGRAAASARHPHAAPLGSAGCFPLSLCFPLRSRWGFQRRKRRGWRRNAEEPQGRERDLGAKAAGLVVSPGEVQGEKENAELKGEVAEMEKMDGRKEGEVESEEDREK